MQTMYFNCHNLKAVKNDSATSQKILQVKLDRFP